MVQPPIANPTSAAAKDRLPQPPFPFLSGAALFCVAFFFLPSRSGLTHYSLSFSTSPLLAPLSSSSPLTRSIIIILPSVLNHSRVICLPFASPSSPPFLALSPFSPSLPRYGKGLISAYPLLAPLPPSSTQGNTYSTSSCHTHFVCTVSLWPGVPFSLAVPFFIQAAFSLYHTTHLHHYPMQAAFPFFTQIYLATPKTWKFLSEVKCPGRPDAIIKYTSTILPLAPLDHLHRSVYSNSTLSHNALHLSFVVFCNLISLFVS